MTFPYGLYDAHCHLFELEQKNILKNELQKAHKAGITGFFCSALGIEQFDWYKNCNYCFWYAGIHPFYEKSKISDLDIIIDLAEQKKIIGIGEIGLDKRQKDEDFQRKILSIQLDVAQQYDLPIVFHVVGKYYDLYKILKKNFPKVRGILHGFSASTEIFELYKKFDIAFSVGNKFYNENLAKFILKYGHFTLETDTPYQKPKDEKDDYNHLINLTKVLSFLERFEIKENIIKKVFHLFSSTVMKKLKIRFP